MALFCHNAHNPASAACLRPYQVEVIERVHAAVQAGHRRIALVAPTGAGKTVIGAEIIRLHAAEGRRVLFLAHRRELIRQASQKLHEAGVDHGVVLAGHPTRPDVPVQVASIPTLHARAIRGTVMDLPDADLVAIDETHRSRAKTYRQIIERFPNAVIIGLTATPCRGDGRGLGNVFDVLIECPPVQALIDLGFLVATRVYAPSLPDLTGVKTRMGDYVERQLADRVDTDTLVGDIVEHWHKLADNRSTIVFASSVRHSQHITHEFGRSGVWAEHLDGSTPNDERDRILGKLARGDINIVSNCMVLTEGFDCPNVGAIVLARPTKHVGLYRQMVGRGLRPAPGKTDCIILDHAGATFQHGFAEDPIRWTLDTDKRAHNPEQASRSNGKAPALTTCPECKAVRRSGQPCVVCGWRPRPNAEAVEVMDGDLVRLDRKKRRRVKPADWAPGERAQFYRELLGIARECGFKPGWAAHKHKERFGDWPRDRYATPAPPSDATRSWVRSRQIAYAKAMAKRGAA